MGSAMGQLLGAKTLRNLFWDAAFMYRLRQGLGVPLLFVLFLFTLLAAVAVADRLDSAWSTGAAAIVCLLVLAPLANAIFARYGPLWLLAAGVACCPVAPVAVWARWAAVAVCHRLYFGCVGRAPRNPQRNHA